ncbi:hypothetical protein DM2_1781 [Halorubrum sp. DM2]|nr:hypothetical protein DM2_1781 [Halorubrum sp. DM2]
MCEHPTNVTDEPDETDEASGAGDRNRGDIRNRSPRSIS